MHRHSGLFRAALILAALLAGAPHAAAWLHPEHRAIAGASIQGLDPARAQALRDLWAIARAGHEDRLCEQAWAGDQGPDPRCIDLAALPALAGDHSCSPADLVRTILTERWVLDVAQVASRLELRLRTAKTGAQRINATRDSDLSFERVDPFYSSRAGANNSHFLLTRRNFDPGDYLRDSFSPGAELNAMGIWLYSHAVALKLATRAAAPGLSAAERGDLARLALAAEFYGEHFLQDAFASGHVAGTWGDVALRKGTHDYYNEHGLNTSTWSGQSVILAGDSHMRAEDRDRAAPVARASLEQFVDALDPRSPVGQAMAGIELPEPYMTQGIETCKASVLPKMGGISSGPRPGSQPGRDSPRDADSQRRPGDRLAAALPVGDRAVCRRRRRAAGRLHERLVRRLGHPGARNRRAQHRCPRGSRPRGAPAGSGCGADLLRGRPDLPRASRRTPVRRAGAPTRTSPHSSRGRPRARE